MKFNCSCLALVLALPMLASDNLATAPPNDPAQRDKPYVLMIGLDGYRPDYVEKYQATALRSLGQRGSKAEGLAPSFPSTTFPNFYTMVTGMRPEAHGLVAMEFYDPRLAETFSYRRNGKEGKWYEGASPLWLIAEKQGLRTASYFWVGTDAPIFGHHPSAWFPYNASIPGEERVDKVLEWLQLPTEKRPHLITLYFPEIDTAGHRFGPDSVETGAAVKSVDKVLAKLFKGLETVQPAVNVIVVSDHGMAELSGLVDLTDLADWSGVKVVHQGPMLSVYSGDSKRLEKLERELRSHRSADFQVYSRANAPKHLHRRMNRRNGDLMILATGKRLVGIRTGSATGHSGPPIATHGFDFKQVPEMLGILLAAGPNVRPGVSLGTVDNIQIFGFVAKILGLPVPAAADPGKLLIDKWHRP